MPVSHFQATAPVSNFQEAETSLNIFGTFCGIFVLIHVSLRCPDRKRNDSESLRFHIAAIPNRRAPAKSQPKSPLNSSGASGGSLHGGASLKVEKAHFAT